MSVSIDVYLPALDMPLVTRALQLLNNEKICIELEESFSNSDPNHWSGFVPLEVEISELKRSILISAQFDSGFEIDVSNFQGKEGDMIGVPVDDARKEQIKKFAKLISITVSTDVPAGLAVANCFAAALCEAGSGIVIECETGDIIAEMQSLKDLLQSDFVDEFDCIGAEDFPTL